MGDLIELRKQNNDNIYEQLICINEEKILKLEKKIFSFKLDKNYNYATTIIDSNNILPKININLIELNSFLKNKIINKKNEEIFKEEVMTANEYYILLTSEIDLKKVGTIREKNIIYYLFHFMNNFLFYILLNPNFSINNSNYDIYLDFIGNFITIKESAELYLNKQKLKDSNILLMNNNEMIDEYYEISKYKIEFEQIIKKINSELSNIIESIKEINKENNISKFNHMLLVLEKLILLLNIFHSINEQYNILDYKYFYNEKISKNLNLEKEFQIFLKNEKILKENIEKNLNKKFEFTLLNYTWIFDPSAKYEIINLFNEEKQIQQVSNVNYHDLSDLEQIVFLGNLMHANNIFCVLKIRRENIIEDTLNEVSRLSNKLHNPLKVKFVEEEAEDEGGVRKEFFMLVTRKLFDPNYGMFVYNEKTRLFWFNLNSFEEKIKFELIGIVLGLALFNGVILDIKFPIAIYKKLLGIQPCLNDLKDYDPELYNNLKFLTTTDNKNLKEDLDSNFTVCVDNFGEKKIIPLKPNGENIMIDYENKNEYVELYLNWFFNLSIQEYYESFEKGFYKVFDKKLSKILSPQELELIICGIQTLDFKELQKSVQYEDYNKDSYTIKLFWEILLEFNEEEKKKFLFFVTGCDRAPINGLSSLPFVISRNANDIELPSAHTCFNNLILPDYKNKELMKNKILTAINYSEGFGLK